MNTEQERALLPCPFCGGPGERQSGGEGESRRYGCSCANWKCVGHASALFHKSQQDAVDEWNTRAALQSQAQIPAPTNRDEYIALLDRAIDMGKQLNVMWEEAFAEVGAKHGLQSQDREDAEQVLNALDSGEWRLNRNLPLGYLTDAANVQQAWMVERQTAPFCDSEGVRVWVGPTAIKALRRGQKAIDHARRGEGGGE